ncbi:cyclin-dependent kinase inhibitor 3 family protein [Halomonadaceae bacterium KBTZ08]
MSYCPGRFLQGWGLMGGQRDLEADLARIRRWGARAMVTLVQESELKTLGVPHLAEAAPAPHFHWFHAPIQDFSAPGSAFELAWAEAGPVLRERLRNGDDVLLHCRAGLGRTGTVAARLLVEFGDDPETAIARVRRARQGTVENAEQVEYVHRLGEHQGLAWRSA